MVITLPRNIPLKALMDSSRVIKIMRLFSYGVSCKKRWRITPLFDEFLTSFYKTESSA